MRGIVDTREAFLKTEATSEFTLHIFKGKTITLTEGRSQITEQYSRVFLTRELKRAKEGWIESKSEEERSIKPDNFAARLRLTDSFPFYSLLGCRYDPIVKKLRGKVVFYTKADKRNAVVIIDKNEYSLCRQPSA